LSKCGAVFIQCNAIVESHHKLILLGSRFAALRASRYNCANNNAPQSSSRGIVINFKGATRDLAHINLTIIFPFFAIERTYRQAPYPTLLASQNPRY
jgi:hypothetical protein